MLAGQRLPMPDDGGAAGPGQTAGGPSAFITYPDSAASFSDADSFALYRYAGDAFQGPIEHFAVAQLTLTDGFGGPPWSTVYVQDVATAACNPSGDVVKYYKTTAYPGTDDIGDAAYGRVEATYLNGLQLGDAVTTQSWSMMDGLQQSLSAYDAGGAPLARTSYGWTVMTQRAVSLDAGTDPVNLYGGYVLKTSQERVIDGVPCTTTTTYVPDGLKAPFSGQPVRTTTTDWDGQGREVTLTAATLYGYEVADAFRTLNILDVQAQTTSGRAPGAADPALPPVDPTVTQAQATVFRSWPSALGPDVMVPAEAAQYSWTGGLPATFPFAGFDPLTSKTPAGWIPAEFITARNRSGMVLETADAAGTVSATLFGTLTALPAAQVTNASFVKEQCAFWSPSPDVAGGFTATGATLRSGDGQLGDGCLELPAGSGASVTATVTPAPGAGTYLLGFWYKTATGFQPAEGAGWTVTAGATARTLPFTDTEGVWIYRTLGIPVTDEAPVTVTAINTAAAAVRLDAMFVQPLAADLEATVYDPRYDLELASMDAAGKTRRSAYDRFQQKIVEVDPCETTVKLTQNFASRRGNRDGIFDPASPNALVTVEPAGGGTTERFLADGDWQARWQPGGGTWTAEGGLLMHAAGPAATLDWRGWGETTPTAGALLLEWVSAGPVSDGPPAGPIAIAFGDGWVLSYDPQPGAGYELAGKGGGQPPLAQPPGMAGTWLLVMGRERILFFADGQLLFSLAAQPGDLDAIRISSGPDAISIRTLSLVAEPRLTVLYQDAAGRSRQSQHLLGDDAVVSATIHDALNRVVASTKSAPASFGADPGYQPMAYQPRFIDVDAFLAALRNSWRLDGALSDYYAGQGTGMQQRSDDQGYPYHGTRHPAGAAKRSLELGLPGKPYAIHDVDTTSPADRRTVQYAYGPNTADGALPDGRYACKTVTTPLKSVATIVTNSSGNQMSASLCGKDGGDAARSNAYADYAADTGDAGRTATVNLPNCRTPGPQSGVLDYSAETLTDPLGRIIRKTDPSSGTTLYIYDDCGRLRFVQPPLDPGEVWFVYHRYDALGRLLEQGTVDQPWDPAALQAAAGDAAWPGADVPHTPWLTLRYDGDGDEPTQIGQKVGTVAVNPAPAGDPDAGTVTVTERFSYDGAGRVAGVTQSVDGMVQAEGTVAYGYNALSDLVSILYPAGSPLAQAVYGYDERGKVVTIGSGPGTPDDIAAFTYTCDGEVASVARNRGRLQASLRYGSPGWVEALEIRSNGAQPALFAATYGYDAQGSVTGRRIAFPTVEPAGTEYNAAYRYDGQRRLVAATATDRFGAAAPGSETIDLYDPNGNIWMATLDGAQYSYTLASGSDRLAAATLDGTGTSFTYAADGWLATGDGLTLEHSAAFQLTTRVAADGGGAVRLAYGGQGQRVVRQPRDGTGGTGVSYSGIGRVPLLAVGADGTPVATVAGPGGVLAVVSPEGPLFPLTDVQGTVWGAVDDQDRLAAWFNFGPFGEPLGAQGPAAERIGYTFLGQRLDAATGLYHFDSRLYAPRLRRFLSPDPAGQFPSPYIFVGNDPVSMTDSDGAMAGWAQGLLDGLTIAALVVGAVLTDGADTPALVAASEGMADEEAANGALDVAKAAGKAAEDAPGKPKTKPMSRSKFFARRTGATAVKGAVGGAKSYAKDSGQNFNAKGLFESIAIGATAGAVRGALGGVVDLPAFAPGKGGKVAGKAAKYAARYAAKGIATAVGNEVSQMLTNAQQHEPWSQNMAKTAIAGFVSGAGFAAVGDASKVVNEKYGPQIEQFKAKAKAGAGTAARGIGTALCGTASALSASYQTSTLLQGLSPGAMAGS
jgi:RHS repeat-associated protein